MINPNDIKDRIPRLPGRRLLVPENGVAPFYATVSRADDPIEEGLLMNAALIKALYNTVVDWDLIAEYKAAGTYTWTAPDIYGDGLPYEIGVFIIGGGGSGGYIGVRYTAANNSSIGGLVGGGAAGYTRAVVMEVTPGFSYNLVVGQGGVPVTYTIAVNHSDPNVGSAGEAGQSSSFSGFTAHGGSGALYGQRGYSGAWASMSGASGGQGSDAIGISSSSEGAEFTNNAAAMGRLTTDYIVSKQVERSGGVTHPTMSLNPFNLKRYLSVGGAGFMGGITKIAIQEVPTLDDGLRAGRSSVVSSRVDVTGESATSPGSGGGGALLGTNSTSGQAILTSGAGADGAVMIYVRRPVR